MKLEPKFKKIIATAVFAGFAALPMASNAASITSVISPGLNELEDTDVERILDAQGNVVTTGNFQVGYVLESMLKFEKISNFGVGPSYDLDNLGGGYSLVAYSLLQVAAITDIGGGACDAGDASCFLTLAATGDLGAGVMAEIYEGSNLYNSALAAAAGIAGVTGGTLVAEIGIGNATDYWFAEIVNSPNQIGALALATANSGQEGQFRFGVSVLSNPAGINFDPDGITGLFGNQHDIIGNGSAYARSPFVNNEWLLSSNVLVQFNAVPEPSTVALLGAIVLGAGFASSRRRKI